jgi:hypothetical protein
VFAGDGEPVFCHPQRPFHDGRDTAITNESASGNAPMAAMKRAGHSDFKTTQGYIALAGETFRSEADRLDEPLFGTKPVQTGAVVVQ